MTAHMIQHPTTAKSSTSTDTDSLHCLRWAWADELEKWLPTLRPGDVKVVKAGTDTDNLTTSKFILCTYDLFQRSDVLRASIDAVKPEILIADESHYLKNGQAKRTQAVAAAAKRCRL